MRDLKPLVEQSGRIVRANPQSIGARRGLALLLYRQGKFDGAWAHLQNIARLNVGTGADLDQVLMALTAQRLGRSEEAKKWLAKADEVRRGKKTEAKEPWEDRLAYETLHREAEALVKENKR